MASVVGTYARAFADVVVGSKSDAARMLAELQTMEGLFAESDSLRRVMDNPSIPGEQKRAVLDAVIKKIGGSRPVRNFIAVLTDHQRLALFSEIVKQVERELNERLGFVDVQVTSARSLGDGDKQLLEAEIAKMTGKRVHARYQEDGALLGGAVVQVGSTIYDGSVNGQLERIREQLIGS